MTDSRGRPYVCKIPLTTNAASSAKASASAAKAAAANVNTKKVSELMEPLQNVCIKKSTGWWTYEVCHFTEVRQYHEESEEIDAIQNWSLGHVEALADPDAHEVDETKRTATVVHQFSKGQECKEIDGHRGGRLIYTCGPAPAGTMSAIADITEPTTCRCVRVCGAPRPAWHPRACPRSTCSAVAHVVVSPLCRRYDVTINVPSLCQLEAFQPKAGAAPEAVAYTSPDEVATAYRHKCFYHVEGWWTYELCLNKHVRQFRQEGTEVQQEYMLGKMQIDEKDSVSEDGEIALYTSRLHKKDPARSFAHASYTGGSKCDLVDQRRQTEVQLQVRLPSFLLLCDRTQAPAACWSVASEWWALKHGCSCFLVHASAHMMRLTPRFCAAAVCQGRRRCHPLHPRGTRPASLPALRLPSAGTAVAHRACSFSMPRVCLAAAPRRSGCRATPCPCRRLAPEPGVGGPLLRR